MSARSRGFAAAVSTFALLAALVGSTRLTPVAAAYVATTGNAGNVYVAAGNFEAGALWVWGENTYGNAGTGTEGGSVASRTQVGTQTTWTAPASGDAHACALQTSGSLWCWGANAYGQNGQGDFGNWNRPNPTRVGTASWLNMAAGYDHSCAVRSDRTLWCWGGNSLSQLGQNSTSTRVNSPVQVGTATDWAFVEAGYMLTCGLRTGGELFCWGRTGSGQVGTGVSATWANPNPYVGSPARVGGTALYRTLAAGNSHVCAIRTNGTLYCWGYNGDGPLGQGDTGDESTPAQVGSATDWLAITAGLAHTCGIRGTGTAGALYCWGNNQYGEAGQAGGTDILNVTQVGSATAWRTVAGGFEYTCGTQTDRLPYCWGRGTAYQTGQGDTATRTSPTLISGLRARPLVTNDYSNTTFAIL
ncbi:MAG TPA: hypothetical protein VNV66_21775 [Pilimelia sp.]|nr:hypothetical protein [Pilimelia sp.]